MLEDIKKFIVKNGIAIIFGILVLLILVLYCLFPHIGDAMTSIGTAVVAISVIFLFYQIKISKSVAISDFVAKIDGEFFSPEMLKSRKEIAQLDFTKKYEDTRACEDILDFFEKIAYLEEKGVISLDTVDAMWGYWIKRYWLLCKNHVLQFRIKKDNKYSYALSERLFEKLAPLHHKKVKGVIKKTVDKEASEYIIKITKELGEFQKEEMRC